MQYGIKDLGVSNLLATDKLKKKKLVIKRSAKKTPFLLKTATQQQHSVQCNYARTLKKCVRKVKLKTSQKLHKTNQLYEPLLHINLQLQAIMYRCSKSNLLNDYFVLYMELQVKSAAVLVA